MRKNAYNITLVKKSEVIVMRDISLENKKLLFQMTRVLMIINLILWFLIIVVKFVKKTAIKFVDFLNIIASACEVALLEMYGKEKGYF